MVRCRDAGKAKQFRRGIEQLDTEGVVQVLSSDLRGDQAPVLAAVGPLQFDVVLHRLEHEFGSRAELDHLDYSMARRTDADGARALAGQRAVEVLTRRRRRRPARPCSATSGGSPRSSESTRTSCSSPSSPASSLSPLSLAQPRRAPSIWSKSPTPLLTPPPPDHCHISAYRLELVWPPKNCAQPPDFRHHPVGARPKFVVSGS